MRWLVLVIGLPVAAGLVLVSMIANWRFGIRLGAEDGDAWAYGLASVCADGLKVILPFAIAWAWQRRNIAEWLSGACLWLVITAYSLVSALSFAAVNREEIAGRKQAQSTAFIDLRQELETKRTERAGLPHARPTATIEAEIRASEQQPRYIASRQCTESATRDLRLFCERHFKLQGELGAAKQAERLDGDLVTIKARLDALPQHAASKSTDPQVELFKSLSGLGEGTIKAALAVLVCLLIELGSGLGLFVVLSCHRALSEEAAASNIDTIPFAASRIEIVQATDADWLESRLQKDPSATISAAELYADYRLWTEARGRANALTVTAFGRLLSEVGLVREKSLGRIVYKGVALRTTERNLAVLRS